MDRTYFYFNPYHIFTHLHIQCIKKHSRSLLFNRFNRKQIFRCKANNFPDRLFHAPDAQYEGSKDNLIAKHAY